MKIHIVFLMFFMFMLPMIIVGKKTKNNVIAFNSSNSEITIRDDTTKINSLLSLASIYKTQDINKAYTFTMEAMNLSREIQFTKGIAQAYNQLASIRYLQSDYYFAIEQYLQSLKMYSELEDENNKAKVMNNLGVVNKDMDKKQEALDWYLKALQLYEKNNNQNGIASTYNNIGIIYLEIGNKDKAHMYFQQALAIKHKQNDISGTTQIYNNIGATYTYIGDYENALLYFQKSLNIEKQVRDTMAIAQTYSNIGSMYLRQQNKEQTLHCYKESLRYAQLSNNTNDIHKYYYNLGVAYFFWEQYTVAKAYLDSSIFIANENKVQFNLKEAYRYLSIIHEQLNEFEKALEYNNRYIEMIHSQSDFTIAPQSVVEYDMQKKDYAIINLFGKTERMRHRILVLIVVNIFIIITGVLLYNRYKLKQKISKELFASEMQRIRFNVIIDTLEKERKRFATDLHDTLGYMLATAKINLSGLENIIMTTSNNDRDKTLFQNSIELIDNACSEVRNISHDLMPGTLRRLGLVAAIKDMISKCNESNTMYINFKCNIIERFEEQKEIHLYRIIQELIHNTIKHAEADKVEIVLEKKNNTLFISIEDNGKGIETDNYNSSLGIGWESIYSRIQLLKGKINIKSEKGQGTIVHIEI